MPSRDDAETKRPTGPAASVPLSPRPGGVTARDVQDNA